MITLNKLEKCYPRVKGWYNLVEVNGGIYADFNKEFPLSSVLDFSGLDDTLGCFRVLPEHKGILEKFSLFCAKEAGTYTSDDRVHNCINGIENYLDGEISVEELSAIIDANDDSTASPLLPIAIYAAKTAITSALICAATYTAKAVNYAIDEKEKEIAYFRKLLDGEDL